MAKYPFSTPKELTKMKLVAYCRVSSLSQEDNGSLQHQEAEIRRYCDYHKHELVEVLHESKTGKNTDRKQYQKMLDLLPEVDGVIAFKIDRISRSVLDLLMLVEDELKPRGKALVLVDLEIDTTKPQGMFFLTVMGAMAEMERHTIRERCQNGLDRAKAEGKHTGGGENKFGYRYDPVAKRVVEDAEEQKAIAMMVHWYSVEGLLLDQIAARLNDMGIPTKQGSKWNKTKLSAVFMKLEVKPKRAGLKPKKVMPDGFKPRKHGFKFIDPLVKSRIYELRLTGLTMEKVAIVLNAEGYRSHKGGMFYGSTICRIIAINAF